MHHPTHHLLFSFFFLSLSVVAHADELLCALQEPMQEVSVRYIHDGDTLSLRDGRRIRIIGINTPELGYKDEPNQPLAVQAREQLRSYLHSGVAFIVHDKQSHDKYGRVLAHVFDQQSNNVGAQLIRDGLGFAVSIPPTLLYRKCYRDAEKQARSAKRGVWAESYFNPIAVDELKYSGFNRVQGCIQRTRKYLDKKYIYLSDSFRFLIMEENAHYFEASPVMLGKDICLIATGWVYNQSSYRNMKLLHPDAVEVINPAPERNE